MPPQPGLNGMIKWVGVTSAIHYQLLLASQQITQVHVPACAQFQFARGSDFVFITYFGLSTPQRGLVRNIDSSRDFLTKFLIKLQSKQVVTYIEVHISSHANFSGDICTAEYIFHPGGGVNVLPKLKPLSTP